MLLAPTEERARRGVLILGCAGHLATTDSSSLKCQECQGLVGGWESYYCRENGGDSRMRHTLRTLSGLTWNTESFGATGNVVLNVTECC